MATSKKELLRQRFYRFSQNLYIRLEVFEGAAFVRLVALILLPGCLDAEGYRAGHVSGICAAADCDWFCELLEIIRLEAGI